MLKRLCAWVAGLWAGLLIGLGFIAAPAGFMSAPPDVAGAIAGRFFGQEAYLALVLSVVLFIFLRRIASDDAHASIVGRKSSLFSADMVLVLGALFCTVAGYFAVQPMMAAAKAGQGSVDFGTLHGLSAGLFGLKTLLVAVLAFRRTRTA